MQPNDLELRALRQFVSDDTTLLNLNTLWTYESDGGCTHMATDGHTMAVRRAGVHTSMTLCDISKLPPKALDTEAGNPPGWWQVLRAPNCEGSNITHRGINPAYFSRVALVEKAAGKHAAEDFRPAPGTSKKSAASVRRSLGRGACATWMIGCDPLDGWYWQIRGAVVWEGIIMPRRI